MLLDSQVEEETNATANTFGASCHRFLQVDLHPAVFCAQRSTYPRVGRLFCPENSSKRGSSKAVPAVGTGTNSHQYMQWGIITLYLFSQNFVLV